MHSFRNKWSAKAQVPCAETFKRAAIGADDVGVQGFGCGDEPGVVLAKAACRAPLEECATSCLCQMQALDRKP